MTTIFAKPSLRLHLNFRSRVVNPHSRAITIKGPTMMMLHSTSAVVSLAMTLHQRPFTLPRNSSQFPIAICDVTVVSCHYSRHGCCLWPSSLACWRFQHLCAVSLNPIPLYFVFWLNWEGFWLTSLFFLIPWLASFVDRCGSSLLRDCMITKSLN